MGSSQSKEPSASRPVQEEDEFIEKPWRKIKGWDKSTRDEMKSKMGEFDPGPFGVPTFNIILTGQVGSGKSSFYNSINSIFNELVSPAKATAGKKARSLTKEFKMYTLQNLRIKIGDTMGIEAHTTEADIRNILKVVEGHVPNGHKFHPDDEFHSNSPGYITTPSLAERAHCVALVINAKDTSNMTHEMVRKLQSLADGLYNRDLPIVVVLTHLDEFLPKVEEDITKTYHSKPLKELVAKISNMVHGLPENQIFPVINYNKQVELDDGMDVLLLYGLRTLTTVAKGYLENQVDVGIPTKLNDSQQEEGPTPLVKEMEKESEKTPTEVDESPMEL